MVILEGFGVVMNMIEPVVAKIHHFKLSCYLGFCNIYRAAILDVAIFMSYFTQYRQFRGLLDTRNISLKM